MLDGGEGVRHGVVAWRLPNRSVGCRHSMASITAALDLTTLVSLPTISIAAAVPVLTRVEHEQRLWLSGHEEKKKRRGRRGSTHKYTQTHRRTHTHTYTYTDTDTDTDTGSLTFVLMATVSMVALKPPRSRVVPSWLRAMV